MDRAERRERIALLAAQGLAGHEDIVGPYAIDALSEQVADLFGEPAAGAPWFRSFETLENLSQDLTGFGVVSDVRIEALILFRDTASAREVLALSCRKAELAEPLLGLLLAHARRTSRSPVLLTKIRPEEIGFEALRSWGFVAGAVTVGYAAQAQPG